MQLWSYNPGQLLRLIEKEQFHFLHAHDPVPYLVILVALYRQRRQQRLEVPFDGLLDLVAGPLEGRPGAAIYEARNLRADLQQLEQWNNVRQRLEPRRIKSLQDKGLERYLVRLTDGTHDLLERLEARAGRQAGARRESTRDHLRDLEDALARVDEALASPEEPPPEALCRVGRDVERARASAASAGNELLRLELSLGEASLEAVDQARLEALIRELESYRDRYLEDLEARRRRCLALLEKVRYPGREARRDAVHGALAAEAAEDPLSGGRVPDHPDGALRTLAEFLRAGGGLDRRCQTVHQRIADVLGHLERHLAALVRRSQLRTQLRRRIRELAALAGQPGQPGAVRVSERLMLELFQSAHLSGHDFEGTPRRRAAAPRPKKRYQRRRQVFGGARVRRPVGGVSDRRPLLQRRLEELAAFVEERILRGRKEAPVSEIELRGFSDVRLLMAAIRAALTSRTFHRRYLRYGVERRPDEREVVLACAGDAGRLRLSDLAFYAGRPRE